MAVREKTIDRIRKVLALTRSSEVNEAANAAAQAAKLMAEHGLTEDDLAEEEDPFGDNRDMHVQVGTSKRLTSWKWNLAWVVGYSARCKPFVLDLLEGDVFVAKVIAFIGRRSDAELCVYLFSYLLVEIKRLHDERRPPIGKRIQRYVPGQPEMPVVDRTYQRRWSRDFYLGATHTISQRITEASDAVMRTASDKALARIDVMNAEVKKIAEELGIQFLKTREVDIVSHSGYASGVKAAKEIDLSRDHRALVSGRVLPPSNDET